MWGYPVVGLSSFPAWLTYPLTIRCQPREQRIGADKRMWGCPVVGKSPLSGLADWLSVEATQSTGRGPGAVVDEGPVIRLSAEHPLPAEGAADTNG